MSDPRRRVTRRSALKLGAAATALPLVHIRTAGAAGRLSFAIWDHWVPTGDVAMKKLVDAWAEKNKVDVQLDFLSARTSTSPRPPKRRPRPGTTSTRSTSGRCSNTPTASIRWTM